MKKHSERTRTYKVRHPITNRFLNLTAYTDDIVGRAWSSKSFWESTFLKSTVYDIPTYTEYRILDCGANYGNHSIFWGELAAKYSSFGDIEITAFEPFPETYNLLVKNIDLNDLSMYITPIQTVLWDKVTRCSLTLGGDRGGNRFQEGHNGEYETATIDSFNFDRVDMMKVDVETAELKLLGGAVETLKRCNPVVHIEVHSPQVSRKSIIEFVEQNGLDLSKFKLHGGK